MLATLASYLFSGSNQASCTLRITQGPGCIGYPWMESLHERSAIARRASSVNSEIARSMTHNRGQNLVKGNLDVGWLCTRFHYKMYSKDAHFDALRPPSASNNPDARESLDSTIWLAQDPTCPSDQQRSSVFYQSGLTGHDSGWHGRCDIRHGNVVTMTFDYRGPRGMRQQLRDGYTKFAQVQPSRRDPENLWVGRDHRGRYIEMTIEQSYALIFDHDSHAKKWTESATSIMTMERPPKSMESMLRDLRVNTA